MSEYCPHCKANLQGEPIPQEYIDKGYYGHGTTHYSRKIGIYNIEADRIAKWRCPDCQQEWW